MTRFFFDASSWVLHISLHSFQLDFCVNNPRANVSCNHRRRDCEQDVCWNGKEKIFSSCSKHSIFESHLSASQRDTKGCNERLTLFVFASRSRKFHLEATECCCHRVKANLDSTNRGTSPFECMRSRWHSKATTAVTLIL